jgi:transposase-like protein
MAASGAGERRRNWTRGEAEAVLRLAASSDLSLRAFARREGIRPRRLYWWKKELKKAASRRGRSAPAGRLVPAVITDAGKPRAVLGPIVIHAGAPPRIEVTEPSGVSPAWVASLVRELERGPCS